MDRWNIKKFVRKREIEQLLNEIRKIEEQQTELLKQFLESMSQEQKNHSEKTILNLIKQSEARNHLDEERWEKLMRKGEERGERIASVEQLVKMQLLNSISDEVEQWKG